MKTRKNLTDAMMAEVIAYAGYAITRRDAVIVMRAQGHDARAVDLFVFGPQVRVIDCPVADAWTAAELLAEFARIEAA